jgi:hypothetical protein
MNRQGIQNDLVGMPTRLSDEPPKKTRILNIQNVFMKYTILFFFSAPPFTGPRKHAIKFFPRSICSPTRSTHATLCSAVLFGICGLTTFVHACECAALFTGCRGSWEKPKLIPRLGILRLLPEGKRCRDTRKKKGSWLRSGTALYLLLTPLFASAIRWP